MAFLLITAMMVVASCTLFGNDDSNSSDGWGKVSMPADLKGEWYANFYYDDYAIKITSNTLYENTRNWKILSVETKDGVYRLLVMNTNQYRAYYFTELGPSSVKKTVGRIAFTLYDAKISDYGAWETLTKKPS